MIFALTLRNRWKNALYIVILKSMVPKYTAAKEVEVARAPASEWTWLPIVYKATVARNQACVHAGMIM